jgi:hypothetical protein
MSKVKPRKVTTPRIVQPQQGWPWIWLVFLAALSLWSWQVFEFGQRNGGFHAVEREAVEDQLRARIAELEKANMALTARAARFERASQIDRAAAVKVQDEVRSLQEERATLRREVAFLKTLVSGEASEELALDEPSLTTTDDGDYFFEVTLSKASEEESTVSGRVMINVLGETANGGKTLSMEEFTEGRRTNIGIKFRNFQRLKTEIALPEGFEPSTIEIAVQPNGNVFKPFRHTYPWKISDDA